MCYTVYIGTERILETGMFVPNETILYFEEITEEEKEGLQPKFSKPNIYHVGSDTCCSCGLAYNPDNNEGYEPDDKKSPIQFIELLKELTLTESIEYYCCWMGDWNTPPEHYQVIDIRNITLEKNYFGLTEREFILFKQQI